MRSEVEVQNLSFNGRRKASLLGAPSSPSFFLSLLRAGLRTRTDGGRTEGGRRAVCACAASVDPSVRPFLVGVPFGARYTRLLAPSILALACLVRAQWTSPGLHWASQGKDRWRQESCIPGASVVVVELPRPARERASGASSAVPIVFPPFPFSVV